MFTSTNGLMLLTNIVPTTKKTAKSCEPLVLQDNARKHTKNQTKTVFPRTVQFRSISIYFAPQHFLGEKKFNDADEALIIVLPKLTVFFVIPVCTKLNSVIKTFPNQIVCS